MTDPEAATAAAIDNDGAEQLLAELVAIDSPSGEEGQAADFLVQWMANHGFRARQDEVGNALGERGDGEHLILLLGHIDTVPGSLPVERRGRELYGRGTVDAKGPLAAFAVAAAGIDLPPECRLIVIGAVEEEVPSSRGAHHVLDSYQPNECIVGEPSSWDRITLGYKGSLVLHWSWRGPLAHSAGPASSPPENAIEVWQAILEYTGTVNQNRESAFRRLDPTLGRLNSGQDGAHGWARMEISFRLPPGLPAIQIEEELRAQGLPGEFQFRRHSGAFVAEKNSSVTRALLAGIRGEGGQPRFVHKSGTSDMNLAGPIWGCPMAAYGPGNSRLDHTPEEHIDLDEYLRAISVLRRALGALVRGAPDRRGQPPFARD